MSADGAHAVWPDAVDRRTLASVDSTNAEAARLAPLRRTTWILGGEQTEGRGRRGRAWASPRGNFHATLLCFPGGPADRVALRSFVASLALREALSVLTGMPEVFTLKWPNDVLLNGGKVAGILLESAGQGAGVAHLCVGIGVNLIAAPSPADVEPGAVSPVDVLAETGKRIAPEALLDTLAPIYARWDKVLDRDGFAPVRDAWFAHAARVGEVITARTGRAVRTGVFETVDATGALILTTPDGRESIPAADIFF